VAKCDLLGPDDESLPGTCHLHSMSELLRRPGLSGTWDSTTVLGLQALGVGARLRQGTVLSSDSVGDEGTGGSDPASLEIPTGNAFSRRIGEAATLP